MFANRLVRSPSRYSRAQVERARSRRAPRRGCLRRRGSTRPRAQRASAPNVKSSVIGEAQAGLEQLLRDQRQPVAGFDLDLAVDGLGMVRARDGEVLAERRVEIGVVERPVSRSPAAPARLASKPSRRVSPTLSKKPSFVSAPALMNRMSSSFVVRNTPACQRPSLQRAAHAGLERLRDDLLERRIGDERVRQAGTDRPRRRR